MIEIPRIPSLGHGLFPWQSAVVESVHVDDLLRFHHDRWLRLVFEPALALEGNPQLVHHGTAEGPLQRERREWASVCSPAQTLRAKEQVVPTVANANFVAFP